jgi:hypothetical protein
MDNMDKDFNQKLLNKIEEKHLAPKPRWRFLLKNWVIWIAGILALLLGAMAVAVFLYLFRHNDWALRASTDKGFWEFFFLTLPYFWLVFFGLFVFIVYYNFKHTKKGYLYPLPFVIIGGLLACLFLGLVFYKVGLGRIIDDVLGRRMPLYGEIFNPQIDFWSAPEEGRLAGVVVGATEGGDLVLLDPSGKEWEVAFMEQVGEVRLMMPEIGVGMPLKIIGEVSEKNNFQAKVIRPLGAPGHGFFTRPRSPAGVRFDCRPGDCRPPDFSGPQSYLRPHRFVN